MPLYSETGPLCSCSCLGLWAYSVCVCVLLSSTASCTRVMQATAAHTEVRCVVLSWRRMLLFSSTPRMLTQRRPKSCLCTLPGLNWKWWVHSANRLLSLCCVTTSSRSAIPRELGQLQNQCAGKWRKTCSYFTFISWGCVCNRAEVRDFPGLLAVASEAQGSWALCVCTGFPFALSSVHTDWFSWHCAHCRVWSEFEVQTSTLHQVFGGLCWSINLNYTSISNNSYCFLLLLSY